jgi:hypothetical protein
MTKAEAEALDERILGATDNWYRNVAPLVMEMRERQGYVALGFKTFQEYCAHIDDRLGTADSVKRVVQRAEVEAITGAELPARHAWALARLPSHEAIQMVFGQVQDEFDNPVERNYITYVDRWYRDNEKAIRKGKRKDKDDSDGWTRADLEADPEVAEAFDVIERVYGRADRKAIQDGTIGLSRKDVIALSAFHPSKMKQVHYLIMANHWDVARAMKFVNSTPSADTTVHELQNHCLGTAGLYYTCSVEGFDISVRACKALSHKITG